ncbi:alpha/beta hydrolase [uncultured Methylibium sp.]|uniref:alpha/beta hydrolase n=1 Tax=uncultured Methylibium sp. TaxID=381093 RepID=UPI0025CE83E4|nr:alpha/beta hydrolase [uncultured Methylibium sp.]
MAGLLIAWAAATAQAQPARVVDLPTRLGVTQRLLVLGPAEPRATVVLFAGGHGGLQIADDGTLQWGRGNFLVRSRQLFADQGLRVVLIDAPSDRQRPPYLTGYRQTPEHVADVRAVIAWARQQAPRPVWLVGTSRGTQSVAHVATQLSGSDGPDGLVLSSTVLRDPRGRPVPDMAIDGLRLPVLVVHHEQDGCSVCAYADMPRLMQRLAGAPRKSLIAMTGGTDRGDPCEAAGHHGFAGLEAEVVARTARWILEP